MVFTLAKTTSGTTTTRTATPIYPTSLALEFSKESEQQFFRTKWNGELTFLKDDYNFIVNANIESKFSISMQETQGGQPIAQGTFAKTDCTIDFDNKIVRVTPNANDAYNKILEGLENEYDLISLAPEMRDVQVDKRMCLQIYTPGDKIVGCFLGNMYWEQDCQSTEAGDLGNYYFGRICTKEEIIVGGGRPDDMPDIFGGIITGSTRNYTNGGYTIRYTFFTSNNTHKYIIIKDGQTIYETQIYQGSTTSPIEFRRVGTTTTEFTATVTRSTIYGRIILNKSEISGVTIYDLPSEDIVDNNRNYHKCIQMGLDSNLIVASPTLQAQPTKYGQYQPGQYYIYPYGDENTMLPVAKYAWGGLSIWLDTLYYPWTLEEEARQTYTMKYSYPLESVISVLLAKIGAGVTFAGTSEYSQFLYGVGTGIKDETFYPTITPKSNILAGEFDEPAKKAPITLKKVFDMLAKTMRCYWFIEGGKLRIEHIKYFMNGLSYGTPSVGVDLTSLNAPNGKKWNYGQGKIAYDKQELPERYEFNWMDDVTTLFQGEPMEMSSVFVEKGRKESISVDSFTSDVDYMTLNPSACDLDGFALLAPTLNNGIYKLPYWSYGNRQGEILQNGYMSFKYLQDFYKYDLPCENYSIGGVSKSALMLTKKMTQQVSFPSLATPNPLQLVKTGIVSSSGLQGGTIRSMSINLTSRKCEATLEYENDTTIPV